MEICGGNEDRLTNVPLLSRVITRPEHLPIVFKDSDKHSKASNNNSGYLMSQILGQCVGLISGNEWRAVRAGVEPPFLRRRAADYVPLVKKHVQQHFKELNRRLSLRSGLLDPAEDLKMLPFWVVAEIFYGELDDNLVDELKELAPLRDALFKEVISGGLARFYISRLLPTGTNRRLHEFQTRWKAFNDRAYQRALMSSCPRESMAPIVNMYELVKQGAMVEGQLLQTIDESVFANLDVTTGGLSWNLVLLAANPVYQARLAQELLGTKSQDGTGGEDHLFHKYILSNTTLLAACISESSRLRPLAAFSVPQSAPTERIIDGYKIPAGTDFIIDSYSLNIRNRAFWGADAAVYRPDRFLEKGGVELRYHFWRFGFGPRQCMGKYVADIIIRALISHVVEHYHLSLLDDEGEWNRHPEVWINHPMMQIRCVKKQRDADVVAL